MPLGIHLFKTIHDAAREGDQRRVEARLRKGDSVDSEDDLGATPLYYASRYGHWETAALLLNEGADPDRPTKRGDTPLFQAAQEGHAQIVKMLLAAGAKPRPLRASPRPDLPTPLSPTRTTLALE